MKSMQWLALDAALADGRPILLLVGAFYDHGTHVLDTEVLDDLELPQFACVRVDADAQPEIASRLPRPGLPRIVIVNRDGKLLADLLRPTRNDFLHLADHNTTEVPAPPVRHQGIADWPCDFRLGGFGRPPKTPRAPALQLLLDSDAALGGAARPFVERTLNAIVQGGLHDHLGGGFHRASADDSWVVPQFGKRAADQAALIPLLLRAADVFGRPQFADAAHRAALWAHQFLAAPIGYYNAEDCDVGPWDDASFHTWSLEEAQEVLDADELRAAQPWFDLYGRGELHSDPTRNVLYIATSVERVAGETGLDGVPQILARATQKLAEAQRRRPRLPIDPNVHVASSARLAEALLAFPETRPHALHTLDHLRPTRDWLEDHAALGVAALAAGKRELAAACLENVERFREGDIYLDSRAPLFGPRAPLTDAPGDSASALVVRLLAGLGYLERAQRLQSTLLPDAIALGPAAAGLARILIAP
jgi:hypothetical protein